MHTHGETTCFKNPIKLIKLYFTIDIETGRDICDAGLIFGAASVIARVTGLGGINQQKARSFAHFGGGNASLSRQMRALEAPGDF